jgi:hypothetical protein
VLSDIKSAYKLENKISDIKKRDQSKSLEEIHNFTLFKGNITNVILSIA